MPHSIEGSEEYSHLFISCKWHVNSSFLCEKIQCSFKETTIIILNSSYSIWNLFGLRPHSRKRFENNVLYDEDGVETNFEAWKILANDMSTLHWLFSVDRFYLAPLLFSHVYFIFPVVNV